MLKFTACCECEHVTVCKYADDYNKEIEAIIHAQADFTVTDVEAKCQHFKKHIAPPRGLDASRS